MKFSTDHEYIRTEGNAGTVGISTFAQEQLGDIVFVELPAVGTALKKGDEAAVVESVKAASEIYAPVSGTVTEVNEALNGDPGLVNSDPEGNGWIFKLSVSDAGELDDLMDATAYASHTAQG
ncbi:glycine cleavage system protein GcvH [Mariluticola halotolerans]|uniref:glycine cleavage system protein GcvH n=1 Tax=Mariluticola halotolerans TaxID=2909283 RepID=UPI0026E409D8|nr:glycine cleavage system protein GcvH [Mariluticola halotolerans]UJQ95841.1 glycine cleavage system protein GcvH [Mariluticola halotolerans]